VSAGLFSKTLANLTHIDMGIRTDHLVTFAVTPKLNRCTDERTAEFYQQLTERLGALPGVTVVSASRHAAISGSSSSGNITVAGYTPPRDDDADSSFNFVGPDYFRALGIPLVAGREFSPADRRGAPKVAIVNEAFVRHFLGGRDALGQGLARGGGNAIKLDTTIVGVVGDAKYSDMRERPPRVLYFPYMQSEQQTELSFYVRTGIADDRVLPAIRRAVASLDPNLPIRDLRTMEEQIDRNLSNERLLSIMTSGFAGLATLLAAIGLYGVLAYNVARRTREIGIRVALGASSAHVRGLVVREVALLLGIGTALGLGAAAAASRLIQSVLYGTTTWDPFVYLSAAAALGIVALAAAYVPARRATSVDPMVALRYE
jgi:predicted permease